MGVNGGQLSGVPDKPGMAPVWRTLQATYGGYSGRYGGQLVDCQWIVSTWLVDTTA